MSAEHSAEGPGAADERASEGDAGATVAVWHPDMSDATYRRLLRLLFDPEPEPEGGGAGAGKAA